MLTPLTRPWYRVGRFSDEHGMLSFGCADIAVAGHDGQPFTSPDHSVTVCLFGNLYSPRADTADAQRLIANAYLNQGVRALDSLQGEFFLVIHDPAQQRLILATDRYGRRPVYYSSGDGHLLFASEIKALLASGAVSREIDAEALADFLAFAFIPGEKTLLRDIHMLPPAGSLSFDLRTGKLELAQYWDLRQQLQPSTEPDGVVLDRLAETFATAVSRRLSPDRTNWLSLSAGMDSRTLASILSGVNEPVKAVTSGVRGGYERKVTAKIASTIGVTHFFYEFDEAQLTRSESDLAELTREAIALTDGMRGTAASAMTAYSSRQRRQHGLESVLTGHGGEIAKLDEAYNFAIRSPEDIRQIGAQPAEWAYGRLIRPNAPRFNTPNLYKGALMQAFSESPRQHLQTIIDRLDRKLPPAQVASYLFLNELYRKRASYALAVQRAYVDIHVPFYDDDFLDAAVRAPLEIRSAYRVHRHIIERHCPKLLDIVLSETRMRPFPSALERVFRGLPYAAAKRMGLFKRDVPEHFFAANANLPFFRKTLQDTITLDRGYFNPDEVAKLLDALERGNHAANTLLHLLTIVELWHRDFIDEPRH